MIYDGNNDPIAGSADDVKAELVIYDFDCDPNEITKQLGLEPTEIRRKGELWRTSSSGEKVFHEENSWALRSNLPTVAEPEDHIDHLLGLIRPHASALKKLAEKYKAELSVYGFIYQHPGLHISDETIKELARLNLSFDFDIYSPEEDFFEGKEQVDRLAGLLNQLKMVRDKNTDGHDEGRAIAMALAVIQCNVDMETLIIDLFWDALNKKERTERLRSLEKLFAEFNSAINNSVILSQTDKRH